MEDHWKKCRIDKEHKNPAQQQFHIIWHFKSLGFDIMEPVALSSVQCLFQFQIHCLPDFPLICKCHLNRNDGNHLQWPGRQEREKWMEKREEDHVEHTKKPCIIANFSIWKEGCVSLSYSGRQIKCWFHFFPECEQISHRPFSKK